MSPTQLSLKHLRAAGWSCYVCEKYNHHIRRRQDAFGFGDILCFKGEFVVLVQTTSGSNMAARKAKIAALPGAALWKEGLARRIFLHGWAKRGPRGKRKTWTLKEEVL